MRCSTQDQGESGLSLDAQQARIKAWSEATGAEVTEIVKDSGVSGTRRLRDRSGGKRLADVLSQRRPQVEAVIVVRLDRLGRDAAETLELLKRFTKGSVGLISISERLDLSTPHGRALAGVSAVFSELERSLIGERTSEALRTLRDCGRVYGRTPYGYDRRGALLASDEREQRTLAFIRELRDCTYSFAAIAAQLNEKGIPSKRGGKWHAMSVRSVLMTSERLAAAQANNLVATPS